MGTTDEDVVVVVSTILVALVTVKVVHGGPMPLICMEIKLQELPR